MVPDQPDAPHTLREPADVQWILPTFFSKFILMMRGKCESRKRLSDSVEITQDVSQWYRECQSCRKKSPLQLLWSAEHDLCGRLGFIHTKPTAWKLLLESDSGSTRDVTGHCRKIFLGISDFGQITGVTRDQLWFFVTILCHFVK